MCESYVVQRLWCRFVTARVQRRGLLALSWVMRSRPEMSKVHEVGGFVVATAVSTR